RQRVTALGGLWTGLDWAGSDWSAITAVQEHVLRRIIKAAIRLPAEFTPHHRLKRIFQMRAEMTAGSRAVDWGCAETWALGSLLLEGSSVRLTGQDVERGTFSHRHAVLFDAQRGTRYVP